jgi:hypothetical protein
LGRDQTGTDAWVSVTASDPLRRLQRAKRPAISPYRRFVTQPENLPNLVGYWPCEEALVDGHLSSGISGGRPLNVRGDSEVSRDSTNFPNSLPLPRILGGFNFVCPAIAYTPTDEFEASMFMLFPADSAPTGTVVFQVRCTGTAFTWQVLYQGGDGDLEFRVLDSDAAVITTTGTINFNIDDVPGLLRMDASKNGANIDSALWFTRSDTGDTGGITMSVTGRTVGSVKDVNIAPGSDVSALTVGHIAITKNLFLGAALTAHSTAMSASPPASGRRACSPRKATWPTSTATTTAGPTPQAHPT